MTRYSTTVRKTDLAIMFVTKSHTRSGDLYNLNVKLLAVRVACMNIKFIPALVNTIASFIDKTIVDTNFCLSLLI